MRTVIQRVKQASVSVNNQKISEINTGLLVLLGISLEDTMEDSVWLSKKIANLRIFNDENGVMNKSINEATGDIIVVSQFTLHAKTKKGNRPSYINAANSDLAIPLYEHFIKQMQAHIEGRVLSGKFGAEMNINLINQGPVTITIDTKNKE